jgi:hypothetical protein
VNDLLRETVAGQIIRFISQRKLLRYPEELSGFSFPYPSTQILDKGSDAETSRSSLDPIATPDPEKAENLVPDSTSPDQNPNPKDGIILVDWHTPGTHLNLKHLF